jgi:Domain of unknown function (DUF4082)
MPEYTIDAPTDSPVSTYGGTDLITVGTMFSLSQAGNAVGIRYYQQAGDITHGHIGVLWRVSDSSQLVQAAFVETAPGWGTTGGWQEIRFTGVALNTTDQYITSVYYPGGFFNYTSPFWPVTVGIITGISGQYNFASGVSYPGSQFNANYFQDIIISVGNDISGSAAIASRIAIVASARQQQHASATISRSASLVNTSRVNRPGSASVAPHSAMVGTAKAIHNNVLTIARAITILAAGNASTQGTATGQLAPHIAVVPTGRVVMKGVVGIGSGAALSPSQGVLKNSTCTILTSINLLSKKMGNVAMNGGISMLAIPNVVFPSTISAATIAAGSSMKAASYTLHNGSCTIITGRPPRNMVTIHSGATLSAVATNRIMAKVAMLVGLDATPRTQANITAKANIGAFDTCQNFGRSTISAGSSLVASATQSHWGAVIGAKAAITAALQAIFSGRSTLSCGAGVTATAMQITLGPSIDSIGSRVSIGATETIRRGGTTAINAGATLLCRGSVRWSVHAALTPGSHVVGTGANAHAVSIAIINAAIRVVAQMFVSYAGKATVSAGLRSVPNAVNVPYCVAVLAPHATLTGTGTVNKLYQALLNPHIGVVALGQAIHRPVDIIRPAILMVANAFVTHKATCGVGAGIGIAAKATNASSSTLTTVGAKAAVVGAAVVIHSSAMILGAKGGVTPNIHVNRQTTLVLNPAATLAAVARMVTGASSHVAARSAVVAGVGHESVGNTGVGAAASITPQATVVRSAKTNVAAGVTLVDAAHMLARGSVMIAGGVSVFTNGGKGIIGSAHISAGASAVLIGLSNFFGGAGNVVAGNPPIGAISKHDPTSTVTQTSS